MVEKVFAIGVKVDTNAQQFSVLWDQSCTIHSFQLHVIFPQLQADYLKSTFRLSVISSTPAVTVPVPTLAVVAIPQGADHNEVLLITSAVELTIPPPLRSSLPLPTRTKLTATGPPSLATSTNCLTSNPALASTVSSNASRKHSGKIYSPPCEKRRKI